MACVPGMPCYSITNVVFPKKCNNGWLDGLGLNTDLILYNGPNLPCTGINFQDTLTCVIDKINDLLCPEALTSAVLSIIQTNEQYNTQFCELVQACLTTTTSTSTSTSTTTSTTTAAPTTTTTSSTTSTPTTTTTSSTTRPTTTTTTSSTTRPTTTTTTSSTTRPTTTTTTSSTTRPTTTTTTSTTTAVPTTTTTTTALPYDVLLNFYGESSPPGFTGKFIVSGEVLHGTTDVDLNFDLSVFRYDTTNCSGAHPVDAGWTLFIPTGSITGTIVHDDQLIAIGTTQSSKIITLDSLAPYANSITSDPQDITIGSTVYRITGYGFCNLL